MTEPSIPPGQDRDAAGIDDAARDWFLRQSAGRQSPDEQARFQAWCDADPRHRAAWEEVSALWADIDDLEHAFAPRGKERAAMGNRPAAPVSQRQSRARSRWRRFMPLTAGLAAVGLLLFVLAPTMTHLPTRMLADHGTAIGEQRRVILPDGSIALLNTNTAIDVAYSDRRRVVRLLHGEAWFEVKKDASRPFDVVAIDGRTTALGTAFAVKDDGGEATVTVTEGVVRVASPDAAAAAKSNDAPVLLEVGQQVSYRRGVAPGYVRHIEPAAATAWRHGAIVIRDRPLDEALAEIGRYRDGRIVLLGNASRHSLVTARLALADIDGGINALAATHGLSVIRVTDWLLIIR